MHQTNIQFKHKGISPGEGCIDRERQLQIINDFAMSLLKKTTINDIVWLMAKSVIGKMGFIDCVIYLLDDSGTQLIQRAAHGVKNPIHEEILNPIVIKLGEGIVGAVAKTGIPEIVGNTHQDDRYIIDDSMRLSEIAVPILYENKVIGVIDSEHPSVNAFNQQDLTTLTTIAAMSSTKIVHAKVLQKIQDRKENLEHEIKIRTEELRETISSLEKSNQDLESFAYAASHDMQEPLRTVISYLQLLRRNEESLSDTSLEFLEYAVDGSKRMKKLLDGLLEYSLVKSSNDVFEPVNLEDILLMVKANLRQMIVENGASLIHQDLPVVLGNRTQIHQLFQNLISNAIKFQPPNQKPFIEITTVEKEYFYQITVRDNGLGIAPAFHTKVFGLFKRLNSIKGYKGSGIGLSLCKQIVEHHQGNISLQSKEGEGTSFIFTLPKA
ncbi:MAG: ATP-binding protein [Saprospiraceae bacterium]